MDHNKVTRDNDNESSIRFDGVIQCNDTGAQAYWIGYRGMETCNAFMGWGEQRHAIKASA